MYQNQHAIRLLKRHTIFWLVLQLFQHVVDSIVVSRRTPYTSPPFYSHRNRFWRKSKSYALCNGLKTATCFMVSGSDLCFYYHMMNIFRLTNTPIFMTMLTKEETTLPNALWFLFLLHIFTSYQESLYSKCFIQNINRYGKSID